MKIAIRYFTMTGNTKKLADAVGEALGEQALEVSCPIEGKVDILFLGSSVYVAGVSPQVKTFISSLNSENIGCIVNFSAAALLKSTYKHVSRLVKEHGIPMCEDEFYCRGSFHGAHKGNPDENDIKDVMLFANRLKEKYENV